MKDKCKDDQPINRKPYDDKEGDGKGAGDLRDLNSERKALVLSTQA